MSCKSNTTSKLTKYQPMPMKTLLANIQALPADLNKRDSSDSSDDSCGKLDSITKKQLFLKKKHNISRDRSFFDCVYVMPTIEGSSTVSVPVSAENVPPHPPSVPVENVPAHLPSVPAENVPAHPPLVPTENIRPRSVPAENVPARLPSVPENLPAHLPSVPAANVPVCPPSVPAENIPVCLTSVPVENISICPSSVPAENIPVRPSSVTGENFPVCPPSVPAKYVLVCPPTMPVENIPIRPPLMEKKESNRCVFPEPVKEQPPKETPKVKTTNTSSKTDRCPPSTPFAAQTPTVSATATGTANVAATPSQPQTRTSKVQYKSINIKGRKYMYIRKLGAGGSSTVYKVLEITTSNEFALKSVNLSSDREMSQGYLNEVKVLRDLQSSDRVIRLYEYDHVKSAKVLNLLLEVGETDLASYLRKHREGVPPALVLHYWEEMLRAVQQIHSHGIVHADLKPANFLLVSGTLKLIDFGIASKVSSDATSVERSCGKGTFSYISPEALGGDGSQPIKVSFYSDIWSLGCILYSLIYGHTPFAHLANMVKIVTIQDPSHRINYPRADHVPSSLLAVLKQCLQYNGHSRPKVTELLQINHIVQHHPSIPDSILNKIQSHLTPREFTILQSAKVTVEALAYAET